MVDFGKIGEQLGDAAKNVDPQQAEQAINQVAEGAKNATGGKYDEQIDGAADKLGEMFNQGDQDANAK
ncbi:Rv0909 family putative TA system antitoxin [Gulosibacter molinativorax]|uniref:Antitoxin protein n=1 Tax=Gulosibacter molinativorax TaxID=256821 RepID=A0ABT7C4H8_9MICO|nr:Rv0909 family putative TA system antitoxin [Gulosibacter molinativorax]MDJ1370118.1 antitoxin protein [Gulosibacter molinativorax]QUY63689.1 Hypotetical protein [Gulosibacter molinativorax]